MEENVEYKVRRAAGINALRKIGEIVAEEQQADAQKAKFVHYFVRFVLIVLLGCALLYAKAIYTY
jgi:cation transport ATPase